MPLHVGWHLAIWFFLIEITWESCMKPPHQDLPEGGGISPYLVLWRGPFPCWLSPMHGQPGST
jgi:hypothetical protein